MNRILGTKRRRIGRVVLCGWCLGLGLPCGAPAAEGADPVEVVLRFANGDSLHGDVTSIDQNKLVRVSTPAIKEVLEFNAVDLSSVQLPLREQPLPRPDQYSVRFVDGDELRGNISVVDQEKLVLDTWYAGDLSIPRNRVRSVSLLQTENVLYEGPTGLEGWIVSDSNDEENDSDSWKYKNGVFYGKEGGGIAREMNLPDMASIDLDVAWKDFLQLTVTIYTKSLRVYQLGRNVRQPNGAVVNVPAPAQPGSGFYALQINRNTLYLLTVREDGQVINSPLDVVRNFDAKRSARLGIRVNKAQKTISLLIDGQFVKTWKETGDFAGQGTALRLVQQGAALINVSNIRVAEWDGSLTMPAVPSTEATTDLVHLRNQDTLSGKLEGLTDGRVSFTTSFGTLDIPVDRVAQIEMLVAPGEPDPLPPGAVRARTIARGTVTFMLDQWVNNRIVAVSPNFGKASFDPQAFEKVEFNVDRR